MSERDKIRFNLEKAFLDIPNQPEVSSFERESTDAQKKLASELIEIHESSFDSSSIDELLLSNNPEKSQERLEIFDLLADRQKYINSQEAKITCIDSLDQTEDEFNNDANNIKSTSESYNFKFTQLKNYHEKNITDKRHTQDKSSLIDQYEPILQLETGIIGSSDSYIDSIKYLKKHSDNIMPDLQDLSRKYYRYEAHDVAIDLAKKIFESGETVPKNITELFDDHAKYLIFQELDKAIQLADKDGSDKITSVIENVIQSKKCTSYNIDASTTIKSTMDGIMTFSNNIIENSSSVIRREEEVKNILENDFFRNAADPDRTLGGSRDEYEISRFCAKQAQKIEEVDNFINSDMKKVSSLISESKDILYKNKMSILQDTDPNYKQY